LEVFGDRVDNKSKLEVIKQEEEIILKEKMEQELKETEENKIKQAAEALKVSQLREYLMWEHFTVTYIVTFTYSHSHIYSHHHIQSHTFTVTS